MKRTTSSTPLGGHSTAERTKTALVAFAFNATRFPRRVVLRLRSAELINGRITLFADRHVDLPPCQSTELGSWEVADVDVRAPLVYEAQLCDLDTDTLLHRSMNWPEPYASSMTSSDNGRFCRLYWPSEEQTALSVSLDEVRQRISVTAARPVKCVANRATALSARGLIFSIATGPDGSLDDNALDLMPGETYTVTGRDLSPDALRWRHLGQTGAQLV